MRINSDSRVCLTCHVMAASFCGACDGAGKHHSAQQVAFGFSSCRLSGLLLASSNAGVDAALLADPTAAAPGVSREL